MVKPYILCAFFFAFSFTKIFSQEFTGHVKKVDSTFSPIFHARVDIYEGYKSVASLRTDSTGSFKFNPVKNQTYLIRISYLGYTDTVFTITTDKDAKSSPASITVKLKKDGIRLVGQVTSADENSPIKDVTVVVKNIMTQNEDRITTGTDGEFNFKLEYESNYKVSVDRRSKGIINKYYDTTFYVSTIGFTRPIDYKSDLVLVRYRGDVMDVDENYDATREPDNKMIKPVVAVTGKAGNSFNISQRAVPAGEPGTNQKPNTSGQAAIQQKANPDTTGKPVVIAKSKEAEQKAPTPIEASVNDTINPAINTPPGKKGQEVVVVPNAIVADTIKNVAKKQAKKDTAVATTSIANIAAPVQKPLTRKQRRELSDERKVYVEDSIAYVKAKEKLMQEEAVQVLKSDSTFMQKQAKVEAMSKPNATVMESQPIEQQTSRQKKEKAVKQRVHKKPPVDSLSSATVEPKQTISEPSAKRISPDPLPVVKNQAEKTNKITKVESIRIDYSPAKGKGQNVPNIGMRAAYFDKNTYTIKSSEAKQLKRLAKILKAESASHLNIYALASKDENEPVQLSLSRAETVIRYLINAGVSAEKISSFYYGSSLSLIDCIGNDCGEDLLRQNRCVAYQLVGS